MTELKPCPFCGGEAEFRTFDTICNVQCKECHIGTRFEHIDDYETVIEAWNARKDRSAFVTVTMTSEQIDEIKEYCLEKLKAEAVSR